MLRDFFAPDGLSRAFFTSGGSDSVEVALRLARQYHKLRGEAGRVKFLSLKKGYHGTHSAAPVVNGNANFRTQYEPLLPGCYHIPAPYTYRNPFNETDPAKLAQLCLAALEDEIKFQGAGTIAAFIMEPVLGAGGVIPPHESFMPGARDLHQTRHPADRRRGHHRLRPHRKLDRLAPLGRAARHDVHRQGHHQRLLPLRRGDDSDAVAEVFESDKSGAAPSVHGYTYSGHPVGAAAALACLNETVRLKVHDNAAARGTQLFRGLEALKQKHEVIGDVRGGHGLMCALELVSDRKSKTPVDKTVIGRIYRKTMEAGVMVRVSGPNIILSPPLILTDKHVDAIVAALDHGFTTQA
jgi:adenosylmethionine-8-amino-7-oxononanoate aminotransferase